MFIVTWLFDKMGYMPKVSIDTSWPFPATQKEYTPHEYEVAPKATKVAKKAIKKPALKKATTRKKRD
jgi:hypothetical protein